MKNIDGNKTPENDNKNHVIQEREMPSIISRQRDIILKKTLIVSNELLDEKPSNIDFTKITDLILEISGSKYASFNVFDANGRDFTTVAFSGLSKNIKKISSILGFELVGKEWKYDPIRESKIKDNTINRFKTLHDLSKSALPDRISSLVERLFNIGPVYVARIQKNNKAIGDFTLLFSQNSELQNIDIVELFSSQVGLLIDRRIYDMNLVASESRLSSFIKNSPIAIEQYDAHGKLIDVNPACLSLFGIKSKKEIEHFSLYNDPNISDDHKKELRQAKPIRYEAIFDFDKVRDSKLYNSSKSGKIWLDVMITPTTGNNGVLEGYLLEIQDISSRKVSSIKINENVKELENLNSIMVGRELKMIELKKEIEALKAHTTAVPIKNDSQYIDGISLEENVIRSLSGEYRSMILNSDLSKYNRKLVLKKLHTLEIDSIRHEKKLREISHANR